MHKFHGESGGSMPLYTALAQSFNTAAIRLSVKIGEAWWPAKQPYHLAHIAALGRAKIVETARAMGLTTPLADTVSLPVGADEVKMIDMVGANAILANGGRRATPYAAIEIRNSAGKLIYSHDADAPPPVQVIPADKVAEMNNIMTHVVTEGTGRAAIIPGLAISGKTGTTNGSTNAWFNAFTGNLVGSVWFGNDDNSPTNGMTGGTLGVVTGAVATTTSLDVTGGNLVIAGNVTTETANVTGGLLDVTTGGVVLANTSTSVTGGTLELDGNASFTSPTITVGGNGTIYAPDATATIVTTALNNSGVLDYARLLSAAFGPPPPDCGLPVAGGDGEGGEGGGFRQRPSP